MKKKDVLLLYYRTHMGFFPDLQMLYDTIVHFNLGFLVIIHVI
jgi:hypothetical protein